MKNIMLVLGILSLSLLFSSCEESADVSPLSMVIEGTVINTKTKTAAADIDVEIYTNDAVYTVISDESGYYQFDAMPSGEYEIVFSHANYLTQTHNVSSRRISASDDTEEIVVNDLIELHPLTEEAYLRIHKYNGSTRNRLGLAKNASYTYRVGQNGNIMSGTTDNEGGIYISELPYKSRIYFNFDFEDEGARYKGDYLYYTNNGYRTGRVDIDIQVESGNRSVLGIVSSNLIAADGNKVLDLPINSDIVIKFNQPILAGENLEEIYFRLHAYTGTYTLSLSDDNDLLTITLDEDLVPNTYYYPDINVKSMDGTSERWFEPEFKTAEAIN